MQKEKFEKIIDSLDENYRSGISELYLMYKEGTLTADQEKLLRDRVAHLLQEMEKKAARFQKME